MTGIDKDAIKTAQRISHTKEIPDPLKAELSKLRHDFEQYRAQQTADKASAEKSHKLSEKRQFWLGALAGAIGSTAANLFIFYWPGVVDFLKCIFH